ncbi:MAG: class I SAM-dependent methyltransferase [Pseudomonadota bacterium]
MTDSSKSANERWDAYWKHGFLTSCADAFQGNYGGAIARHWEQIFADIKRGEHVLDVCTGNGAVAALAARHGLQRGLDLTVTGIDLAAIEPDRALAATPELLDAIQFHGRTPAQDTGLASQSIDLAVGQYALEYTPLPQTLDELARVVRPGGRLAFVLHDQSSVILETTREELAHRERLAPPDDVLSAAAALATAVAQARHAGRSPNDEPAAERARLALNAVAADTADAARQSAHPEILMTALGHAKRLFESGSAGNPAAIPTALASARHEIEANFERLDDLMAAAATVAERSTFFDQLCTAGFEVEKKGHVKEDNLLIGWFFSAIRAH